MRREWAKRLDTVPFDVAIGALTFANGIFGLLNIGINADALSDLIGGWQNVFQGIYMLAGGLMLLGIALGRRDIEAPGLTLLASSNIIRTIALVWFFHLTQVVWVSLIFNAVIVWACWRRTRFLARGEAIVRVENGE